MDWPIKQVWYSGGDSSVADFTPEFCSAVIKFTEAVPEQKGAVDNNEIRQQVRNNTIFPVTRDYAEFCQLVFGVATVANREAGWNFDLTDIEPLQISRYGVGEQYGWHMDLRPAEVGQPVRKLTFNVVLNEDYEGGDFQFSWGSPSAPYRKRVIDQPQLKERGRICVFPSLCWHRVKPVMAGVRYSLTGWITGPSFR